MASIPIFNPCFSPPTPFPSPYPPGYSGGYPGSIISGADRYFINITEAQFHGDTAGGIDTNRRSILLTKTGITFNYINNLLKRGE